MDLRTNLRSDRVVSNTGGGKVGAKVGRKVRGKKFNEENQFNTISHKTSDDFFKECVVWLVNASATRVNGNIILAKDTDILRHSEPELTLTSCWNWMQVQ